MWGEPVSVGREHRSACLPGWPLRSHRVSCEWRGQALGGDQRMRGHDHMWQRGRAFQLSESIWHGCHRWQRRETQSSFHRIQAAPSPGPEAELGTVGSRHVLAGWQSRWGSPLLEVLREAGLRQLRRPCPAFQPTCLAPVSGAFQGQGVWLPCLGELPRAG